MLLLWDSMLNRFSSSRVSWFSLSSEPVRLPLGSFQERKHIQVITATGAGQFYRLILTRTPAIKTHPAASHKQGFKPKLLLSRKTAREATPW